MWLGVKESFPELLISTKDVGLFYNALTGLGISYCILVYCVSTTRHVRAMSFWKPGEAKPPQSKAAPAPLQVNVDVAAAPAAKSQLSSKVTSMRFMKRKEEGAEQMKEEMSKRSKLLDTVQLHRGGDADSRMQVVEQSSLLSSDGKVVFTLEAADLFSTLPGRRSFNGFNKVVEREYANALDDASMVGSVGSKASDEAILKQYEGLIGLPRGPGQGKRPKSSGPLTKAPGQGKRPRTEGMT